MKSQDRLDLLANLATKLSEGHLRPLFRYLEIRKSEQLVAAQESAFNSDPQSTVYCVLATSLYEELLSWQDSENGALAQEVHRLREDLKIERDSLKAGGDNEKGD